MLDETAGPVSTVFVAVRRLKRTEFFDINAIATIKQSAALKAAMVDNMRPVWAAKHPVTRFAQVRIIEVSPGKQKGEEG